MTTDHTEPVTPDRKAVVAQEKEAFGGVKIGSAFFGWLTATGMTVILAALVAAAGAGIGLVSSTQEIQDAAQNNNISADEIGWAGVVLVLVVVFLSYYSGGYVAGRMARFNGAKQGAAVFGWTVVIAIVVAVLGAVAGAQYNVLDQLNSFPRIPDSLSDLTVQGIVVLAGVVVAALVGGILGGLAGMHFHRKVDRAGLGR
jgi:heme/copper-type cytochrome/quinol oxidase subunit 2